LKILLVLGKYLPEKNGGIENYSHCLATILLQNGHCMNVAILESDDMEPYIYETVNVIPLKNGFDSFSLLLQEKHYDVCHFQEYSGKNGIYIEWFRIASKHCKKVFFTFHLPYLTCYKNDFRYMGIDDCNTFNSPERCVKCIIATKLNYKQADHFSLYNAGINLISPVLNKTGATQSLKTRIDSMHDDLKKLILICDNVFIIAEWFKEILIENGFQSSSLINIPPIIKMAVKRQEITAGNIKKKILFAGRIERQKGLHLLCKAMNIISTPGIQLEVFGNIVEDKYFNNCVGEYTFNYKGTLPRAELLKLLPGYDFLILPSVFTEMYSMILQEAINGQLPVIGSAAKGNKDMIKESKTGFIFDYGNHNDWARVIDKAYYLKQNGWKPESETNDFHQDDLKEILSYYS
jgi:glycosyltransferase involved in cell wall biosynthesis